MALPTASAIIGLARNLLREDAGSDVPVVSDAFMLTALSEANQKYYDAFNTDGNEPVVFQREWGKDLIADTTLNAIANTTDITLTLTSSTSFPVSGYVLVWHNNMPDLIPYTGNNLTTTLTGVSGIQFAKAVGDAAQVIYALPANFGEFRESPAYGDGVMLNGFPMSYMGGFPTPGFFSIYDDGTTKYLILPRQSTGSAAVLYDKNSSSIVLTTDTVDVPEKYQYFLIWHLVAMAYIGREDDFAKMEKALALSDKVLQRALLNRNTQKNIRARSFGRISKDYTVVNGSYISLG